MRGLIFALIGGFAIGGCEEAPDTAPVYPPDMAAESERPDELEPEGDPVFTGVGQEPGWTIRIYDNAMVYDADYGQRRVVVPTPEPLGTSNDRRYSTGGLTIDIVYEPCQDAMSGAEYSAKVTVTEDERTLEGCGGEQTASPEDGV